MGIIKTHNNVPDIYTKSRDFQLLSNLYSLTYNGAKYDTDTIEDITSTTNIRSNLLPLLAKKLGWFSSKTFTDEELRQILQVFPYLLKGKGSKEAIVGAVHAFLHIKQLDLTPQITFYHDELGEDKDYLIQILLDVKFVDTTILDEIFKYILPVGWDYKVIFGKDFSNNPSATSHLYLKKPTHYTDEIVLTTDSSFGASTPYIPTSDVRGYMETTYVQNLLIGAEDEGYVQGSDDASDIYLIEGNPRYSITVNVVGGTCDYMSARYMYPNDSTEVTIHITPNEGYVFNSSDIRGATSSFDTTTNTITLTNATSNVLVNVLYESVRTPLPAPTNLRQSSVYLSWDAVAGATLYSVYDLSNPSSAITGSGSNTINLSGTLSPGTYQLGVKAMPMDVEHYTISEMSEPITFVME